MLINYVVLIKRVSIPLIVGFTFLIYKYFPTLKQDSLAEEIAEEFIEVYTGRNIDLSPSYAKATAGRPETPEIKIV